MATIKIPISVDGATFDSDVEEQRQDGTRATELSLTNTPVYALEFDGVDEDIVVPHHSSLQLATDFSISSWFKCFDPVATKAILAKWGSAGNRNYYIGFTSDNSLEFYVDNATYSVKYQQAIADGEWHHLVCVADSSNNELRIYYDNSLGNTDSYDGSSETGTNNLEIADNPSASSQHFHGQLDEIAIWERVLSTDDIGDLYNSGSGYYIDKDTNFPTSGTSMGLNLVGLWHLDEGSGSVAYDSSANSNDGTLQNMEAGDWVDGKVLTPFSSSEEITLDYLDSGVNDSIWDMSSIEIFENPNSEAGTIKYQYAYGNTANPTNWNGSWLTKGELRVESDPSGRYFNLKVQLTGDGSQDATVSDGWIEVEIPTGGTGILDSSGLNGGIEGI